MLSIWCCGWKDVTGQEFCRVFNTKTQAEGHKRGLDSGDRERAHVWELTDRRDPQSRD